MTFCNTWFVNLVFVSVGRILSELPKYLVLHVPLERDHESK